MDNHTKAQWIIAWLLLASCTVFLGIAGYYAYLFAQIPVLLDSDPVMVGFPVEVPVEVIVATSSENLPAVK